MSGAGRGWTRGQGPETPVNGAARAQPAQGLPRRVCPCPVVRPAPRRAGWRRHQEPPWGCLGVSPFSKSATRPGYSREGRNERRGRQVPAPPRPRVPHLCVLRLLVRRLGATSAGTEGGETGRQKPGRRRENRGASADPRQPLRPARAPAPAAQCRGRKVCARQARGAGAEQAGSAEPDRSGAVSTGARTEGTLGDPA